MQTRPTAFLSRLRRLGQHVRNGTLPERLRASWEASARERGWRRWRWDRDMRRQGYFDHTLPNGARLRLYGDSILSELIFFQNFESKEQTFLRRFLRHGDIFVDVGANIGLFAVSAAPVVGPAGRVYAFEPNPTAFARLDENVRLNRLTNVTTYREGLSRESGAAPLVVSTDGYDAWSSFGKPIAGQAFESIEVPTTTWSDFVRTNRLDGKIAMAKLDVEGWEAAVLEGGLREFAAPDAPLLQVEFTQRAALNANSSCAKLFDMLTAFGYRVCSFDPAINRLTVVPQSIDYEYQNLYATKDHGLANRRLETGRG
jgi:FkbM family methyltransferase